MNRKKSTQQTQLISNGQNARAEAVDASATSVALRPLRCLRWVGRICLRKRRARIHWTLC